MEFLRLLPWLLALAVLTGLGAPIAAVLFRSLPRRGAAFALPTALVPFAIAVFWIGQVTFGVHTVLLGLAVVAGGALLAHRRGARPDWRAVAGAFGVFLVGFAIMVAFRSASPSITPAGGEQFLHFGLVNALERAPALPPEDFWFAGEPLQYYYGTQLQVTGLSMLSATPIRYGFNLGIATFYGALFVVAYGLVGSIVEVRGYSHRVGGALGALFVAIAGHATTAIRLLTPSLPDGIREPVARAAFGFAADRFYEGDLQQAIADLATPLDWTWWYTRYVVPGTIQEVPLYAFVKGELHGHTISTAYVIFAGALAYAYYRTPRERKGLRVAIVFGGLGAVAGVFGFMNTWALPTAGGLAVLAVAAADPHPASLLPGTVADRLQPWTGDPDSESGTEGRTGRRILAELWRLVLSGVVGAVVLLVGVVIASPFLVFGHVPSNEGLGFFPPRSPLWPFLVVYGGLLAVFAVDVAVRGWPVVREYDRLPLIVGAIGLSVAVVATTVVLDFAVLAVTGPLLLAAWYLVRTDRGGFGLVLLVAGVGLLLSFEVVHAKLPAINAVRWNTAYKISIQGWTLAAAGGAVAATMLLSRAHDRLASANGAVADEDLDRSAPFDASATGLTIARGVVVLVLLTSLVFPVMVVGQEIGGEIADGDYEPTLDGLDNLEQYRPAQAEAIHWLNDLAGTPTIVEAPGPSYRFTSSASVFTGLPTVVGWDHQAEYRRPAAYQRRVERVDQIYTANWSTAADRLAQYDVRYVYVSPNERERYGDALRSFDRPAFDAAFENDEVTIYAVNQSAL